MSILARFAKVILVVCLCSRVGLAQVEIPKAAKAISAKYYKIGEKIRPPKPVDAPEPIVNRADAEKANKAKTVGTALLWIAIGTDGAVDAAYVVRSLGPKLDNKALEAVRKWKFEAATRDGVPCLYR